MAIRTNPGYATAQENLGDVYARLASQAYNKALQLDPGNTAVQPKLALIRDVFKPGNKGARPAASKPAPRAKPVPATAAPAAAPAPGVPAPMSAMPVPTSPTPIAAADSSLQKQTYTRKTPHMAQAGERRLSGRASMDS